MTNKIGRLRIRHLLILLVPAIGTMLVVFVWASMRSLGWFVPEWDAEITTNAYLPTLGAIYALAAAVILNRVIEEDVRVHQLVEAGDIEGLKRELKKRIHPLIHILMALLTTFLLVGFATLPYESLWSGIKDVGSISLCLFLYWSIAIVLDNPLHSPWIRDVIPLEMRERLGVSKE